MATDEKQSQVTLLLGRIQAGDEEAKERLFRVVYEELREAARGLMRGERKDHTLEATALVHEAVIRLMQDGALEDAPNRKYFFGAAIGAMRQILVDHARHKKSLKAGGHREREPLDDIQDRLEQDSGLDLESLDAALAKLEPRQREVVEHRFFGGLSVEQTAEVLGVSIGTVERDWRLARAKLRLELKEERE